MRRSMLGSQTHILKYFALTLLGRPTMAYFVRKYWFLEIFDLDLWRPEGWGAYNSSLGIALTLEPLDHDQIMTSYLTLSWLYVWQIDQYWSINDQLSIFVTDSESAENLEVEVFSNADHDHARVFAKLRINWSAIDDADYESTSWFYVYLTDRSILILQNIWSVDYRFCHLSCDHKESQRTYGRFPNHEYCGLLHYP